YVPEKTDTYNIIVVTEKPGNLGGYILNARALLPGESMPPPRSLSGYFPPSPPGKSSFYAGTASAGAYVEITPAFTPTSSSGGYNEDGHGYAEYRFTIENRSESEAHRVQLTIPRNRGSGRGYGHFLQAIKRSVEVGPKAKATLSLFQPDLAIASQD